MADTDTPGTETPAKKPARRRTTTPAKSPAPRATPAKAKAEGATPTPPAKKAKAPAKPRSTKRQAAPATRRAKVESAARTVSDKVGGKWGAAAIAGGLAAAGAAAAALLTLRGSTAKPTDPATPGDAKSDAATLNGKAHQPDGTDSSASFAAGIADENTVPDKV